MNIVLKETEWAKDMIETNSIGKNPFETLYRISRYYLDQGYSKEVVRRLLDEFLLRCMPNASLVQWEDTLDKALKYSLKHKSVNIDRIDITKPEIEKINALDNKQAKRLAFTLLFLAKYRNIINPNNNSWVNTEDYRIMSMANINTSSRRKGLLYWILREDGMLQFARKVDNTSVRVLFIEEGETALSISDVRNIGYQYLKYCGEPFFECEYCGIVTKYNDPKNKRKQKYCKECAADIIKQRRITLETPKKYSEIAS